MQIDKGLVLMSDTRTNSGVDNISVFRKMHSWTVPGERIITIMTAGNLATTQAVIGLLEERNKAPEERLNTLLKAPTMFEVASQVGMLLRDTIARTNAINPPAEGQTATTKFTASIIVAGQIKGMQPRLYLVYPEGNFIEASPETPFFQIGETKYGRPIILRGYDGDMSFEDAVKLLMVSFDSTIKANLSVGPPLDLMVIEKDALEATHHRRITPQDPYFLAVSAGWSEALKNAFHALPDYSLYSQ